MATGTGSPCGACKFLRRKCAADCIFAPYFWSEQGPARFAAIHKVFGASNVSKLLLHVPVPDRCEAVFTIAYEAQARIRDPIYGCVAHMFALQQQVAYLEAQVMQVKAQLARNMIDESSRNAEINEWPMSSVAGGIIGSSPVTTLNYNVNYSIAPPQSVMREPYSKKRPPQTDLSELQELALAMIKNQN
ncbi:LOB domain-containing protein 16-like [Sesamum indicum]|uniref:LOB domain-containing protein 16-like n=1 Tax=Sesamum indicum TaxID=4182 RepID=A0A6I9T7D2_SESIN|nr:LOB domain-containing protein 16-like [Sesamum indicum]